MTLLFSAWKCSSLSHWIHSVGIYFWWMVCFKAIFLSSLLSTHDSCRKQTRSLLFYCMPFLFSITILDAAYAWESIRANEWNLSHGFCSSRPPDYFGTCERAFHFEYGLLEAQRTHCQVHRIARAKCWKEDVHVHNQLIKVSHVNLLHWRFVGGVLQCTRRFLASRREAITPRRLY